MPAFITNFWYWPAVQSLPCTIPLLCFLTTAKLQSHLPGLLLLPLFCHSFLIWYQYLVPLIDYLPLFSSVSHLLAHYILSWISLLLSWRTSFTLYFHVFFMFPPPPNKLWLIANFNQSFISGFFYMTFTKIYFLFINTYFHHLSMHVHCLFPPNGRQSQTLGNKFCLNLPPLLSFSAISSWCNTW